MKFVKITHHRRCISIHFSIQPTHKPTHDRRPNMRAVGRPVVTNFPRYSGAQIHLLGRRTF